MNIINPFRFSKKGASWLLDGVDEFIEGVEMSSVMSVTSPYSISIWFKVTGTDNQTIFDQTETTSNHYMRCYILNGNINFYVRFSGVKGLIRTTATFNDDVWHNVICVRETSSLSIYVDGVLQPVSVILSGAGGFTGGTHFLALGALQADITPILNYFTGSLAEFNVFDTDVGASASDIYNGGSPRNESSNGLSSNLVLSYSAVSTSNGVGGVSDSVSSNDGTMINMNVTENISDDYPS